MCEQRRFVTRGAGRWRALSLTAALAAVLAPGAASAQTVEFQPVFADGFESGDLSAWDAANNPGGDLTASANAAMTGSFGLDAFVNDTSGLYVQDDTPADDSYYRASFQFDPNGFDPGESQNKFRTRIFIGFEDGPRRLFAVVLRRIGGQYAIMGRARLDDNSQANTGFVDITDDVHTIDLYWHRSSGPDANDGTFEISIDGAPPSALTGLDNSISSVDFVRLGALSVKPGATGNLYWDAFASSRNLTAARAQLVINEVDYDQIGTDTAEFIEVYNPGPDPVNLNGVGMLLVNGGTTPPSIYGVVGLGPAGSLAAGQYLIVGPPGFVVPAGVLFVPFAGPGGGLQDQVQNGPSDGILLGHATTCHLIDALAYEGAPLTIFFGTCGVVSLVEGTALDAAVADSNTVDGSLIRDPNGVDTDDANTDWSFTATATPGAANVQTP
jgi:hypothetical protein